MTQLRALEDLLTELTGVVLTRGGLQSSLAAFAESRARALGLESMDEYFRIVALPGSDERRRLIDVISVPHTWFFRDREQLDSIVDLVCASKGGRSGPQIWIPACATGEDAYSLAILFAARGIEPDILATDMSPRAIEAARAARYGAFSLRDFPHELRHFLREEDQRMRVCDEIRRLVRLAEHNLMSPGLRTRDGWDLIVCRNVTIYFDQETAVSCAERLSDTLSEDGWLFFGAGEMALATPAGLTPKMIGRRVGFQRTRLQSSPPVPDAPRLTEPENERELPQPSYVSPATFTTNETDSLAPQKIRSLVEATPAPTSGAALFEGSDLAQAASDIMSLAAKTPSDPNLRMLSSIALYSMGDFSRALQQARATLLLDRHLWPAALYHGLCLEKLGRQERARADFAYAAQLLETPEGQAITLPPPLRGLSGDLLEMLRAKSRGP